MKYCMVLLAALFSMSAMGADYGTSKSPPDNKPPHNRPPPKPVPSPGGGTEIEQTVQTELDVKTSNRVETTTDVLVPVVIGGDRLRVDGGSGDSKSKSGARVDIKDDSRVETTTGPVTVETPVTVEAPITDITTVNNNRYQEALAPAAAVFAGDCQTGFSGSAEKAGFSISTNNQFCKYIRAADYNFQRYLREKEMIEQCQPLCVGVCTKAEASVELMYESDSCDGSLETAQEYLDMSDLMLDKANTLVLNSEYTGQVGSWVDDLLTLLGMLLLAAAVL